MAFRIFQTSRRIWDGWLNKGYGKWLLAEVVNSASNIAVIWINLL